MLQLEQVTKSYAGGPARVEVLRGVDFTVSPGETVALTGESGSGKSTLLHLIAGLDDVDGGRISLDGQALSDLDDAGRARLRRDRLGLVFQQFNLVPSLKIADNLAFQARLAGWLDAAWQRELVDRLGLADLLHRFPEQLSGGQQQRVAIGRALAIRPALILADEPTGNLDETTGDAVLALCLDLVARSGAALLMVTHSERLAGHLDRRLHLSAGRLV